MKAFEEIEAIHELLIDKFGGSKGIRDRGGLNAAVNRPLATFDGKDLYPSIIDKSAALMESLVGNHPFIDGNKRTGYVMVRLLLMDAGYDIFATQEEKYAIVISVSKGEAGFDAIKEWLNKHVKKIK